MISVTETEQKILGVYRDFGTESLSFRETLGRILAEDICADRDLPPYDRVTMDGIAIRYSEYASGMRSFRVAGIQAAGEKPLNIEEPGTCIEIMTGAAMPAAFDTVVRYEDIRIENGMVTIHYPEIKQKHNVHYRGSDKQKGCIVVQAGALITPAIIGIAASVGKSELMVKKMPRVAILSTGDELVDVKDTPNEWQIRRSNTYVLEGFLRKFGIRPDLFHITDQPEVIKAQLEKCLAAYDILLLSGGISMGKFDHLPEVLTSLGVDCLVHKVNQRPGKPFWFGAKVNGSVVFAFPGNPVSATLCMVRYGVPWLQKCLGHKSQSDFAVLDGEITFKPNMTWFQQVRLHYDASGVLTATPNTGNGSGDFSNLAESDAFMELPAEKEKFSRGVAYRIWRLN